MSQVLHQEEVNTGCLDSLPTQFYPLEALLISFPITACLLLSASPVKPGSGGLTSHRVFTPSGLCPPCSDCVGVPAPCPGHSRSEASAGRAEARGHPAVAAMAGNQAKASSEKSEGRVLNTELVVLQ